MEFYSNASEEIPKDLPHEKGPSVRMTVYIDADHAHLMFLNFNLEFSGKEMKVKFTKNKI
jgi:hypothetical protein